MDQEIMALMKSKGTYYVPTIMAGNWVAEKAKIPNFFPALVKPKAEKIGPQIEATFVQHIRQGSKLHLEQIQECQPMVIIGKNLF